MVALIAKQLKLAPDQHERIQLKDSQPRFRASFRPVSSVSNHRYGRWAAITTGLSKRSVYRQCFHALAFEMQTRYPNHVWAVRSTLELLAAACFCIAMLLKECSELELTTLAFVPAVDLIHSQPNILALEGETLPASV